MKSGVYYLYEYKNNQKTRNVGFLKLAQQSNSCSLNLCARGLSVFQNDTSALSALFPLEDSFSALPVESVPCENHAITCRLEIPAQSFSDSQSSEQPVGFLLELPDGSYIAALEENIVFTPALIKTSTPATNLSSVPDCRSNHEFIEEPDSQSCSVTIEEPEASPSIIPTRTESEFQRLSRSELSVLPRQYWHLANNSFLLHGYYNYNHLLLIEEEDHFLLGVPGIFDRQEARAAELFGFPSFSDSYTDQIQLSDDDFSASHTFGHWFRKIPR